MNLNQVEQMAEIMQKHDLAELSVEDGSLKIALKRASAAPPPPPFPPPFPPPPLPPRPHPPPRPPPPPAAEPEKPGTVIRSPLVGTFYRAASPEADPFVRVGDRVARETVVCLVEAMKVMNEVKAETAGVVREIRVENGAAVQYGQPLFTVEPE